MRSSIGNGGVSEAFSTSSGGRHHLDLAGREVGVLHAFGPQARTAPDDPHDVLGAESLRGGVRLGRVLGVEDDLHDALAVAEVDEGHAAVVAAVRHPPAEGDVLPRVRRAAARRRRGTASWFASSRSCRLVRPVVEPREPSRDVAGAARVFCTPSTRRRSVTAPVRELPFAEDRGERRRRRGRPS